MRRLVLAVPVLLLASGCSAVSKGGVKTTPNQPAANTTSQAAAATTLAKAKPAAKIGDTISANGSSDGEQLAITLVKIVDPASSANQFLTPAAGNRYVAVQFRLKNTGTGSYSDDPDIDVAAIDGAGQQYDASLGATTSAGAKLNSNLDIAQGDSVLGFEVFEVPKAQKIVKVQYKLNMGLGGDVVQWTIG
jgi:hypothetical protein